MSVSGWGLRHPVRVAIVTAGAFLFGILALLSMNREFIPSIVMPSVSVVTIWPGVGAEDVERDVTSVLENHFATMSGLNDITSESSEGVSAIFLRFKESTDAEVMKQEVGSRVDTALAELPDGLIGDPLVSTFGAADLPVFSFAVSSSRDADRLSRYIEDVLQPEIYRVDGVAKVAVLGDRRLELQVTLNADAMYETGVVPLDVYGAINQRNTAMGGGLAEWAGRQWAFRVSGEFNTVADLENLVVGSVGNRPIRLLDIAEITNEYSKSEERIRSNGNDLVVVQVTKRDGGNTIEISKDIRSRLAKLEAVSDKAYSFAVLHDDSDTVRQSLGVVVKSAITGILMAVAVIWFFLRSWKATLVTSISLPVSLVITFAGMKLAGLTMNVLTMAGMTVSLGMVVDASIVILENIHSRRSAGNSPEDSALLGSGGVASAVAASTSTSVSVFLPMIFLSGIIGIVMKDLSVTLVLTLLSSLAAAIFIVPPLTRKSLSVETKVRGKGRIMARIERSYRTALERSLGMSKTVLFAAAVVLIVSVFAADRLGLSFLPEADYSELFVSIKLPPGSSLDDSTELADRAERFIRSEVPEISQTAFFAGMESDLAGASRERESVWGQILLVPTKDRKRNVRQIIDSLNTVLPEQLPGSEVAVLNGGFDRMLSMGTDGAGFRVEIRSESWPSLATAADRIESLLASDPDIVSTGRDVTENRRTVTAILDGDVVGELGLNAANAALSARIASDGIDAGDFRPLDGPSRVIRLNSTLEGKLADSSALNRLGLRSAGGTIVPMDSVSRLSESSGVSEIRRRDRSRTLTVIGYTDGENIRGISKRLETALSASPLSGDVEWRIKGVSGLVSDSLGKMGIVLLVALFLVYAVMAIQFERFIQPLIIMASVPFCFIGVVGGLALFGSNLSLVSFLGIVALGGIVVNNAIVQVDYMNQLRASGMSLDDAVLSAAVARLRPILMTTLTTFFGVLPLSLATGAGARIYAPLGQAIAGGLVTSTLVTLFIIPVLYRIVENRIQLRAALKPASTAVEVSAKNGVA